MFAQLVRRWAVLEEPDLIEVRMPRWTGWLPMPIQMWLADRLFDAM